MFIDICDKFGGSQLYFPKKESVLRASRNRQIKKMYNIYSKNEIAKKFVLLKGRLKIFLRDKNLCIAIKECFKFILRHSFILLNT